MKLIVSILLILPLFMVSGCLKAEKPEDAKSRTSVYDYDFVSLQGKKVEMGMFKGKNIMIVNVASECGFTDQYEGLEKLHRIYKDKLVIIGFPANDFMGQEPGTNEEIAAFCRDNYDVTFLMSEKITVVGNDRHPIYKWLTDKKLNGWNEMKPKWNFFKYIVNTEGELVKVLPSTTEPMDEEITELLKK